MTSHKFKIGDRVCLTGPSYTNTVEVFLNRMTPFGATRPQDIWEVTRLLPADTHGFQYHIRGSQPGPARLAREEQLQSA